MAVYVITAEYVAINGVTNSLNDHVKTARLSLEAPELDVTAMGDTAQEVVGGVPKGSLSLEFFDDYSPTSVDAILFPLFNTVVTFSIKPTQATTSTSNPSYSGSVLVSQHNLGGTHGELAMKSVTFPTSGAITRANT